jgi:RNA polymerase sigma factor (sigma-70 family)
MSADPTVPDERSDAQLLAAFTAGEPAGREAAFAVLVARHALMVLNTCRRIVGSTPDAEDAGQAVFLTLAHKARTLVHHPTIAGWLHRAARNISIRSRDARLARQRREGLQEASSMHTADEPWSASRREELREVLDAGLERLSERYRLPLVLHYLEGRTQDEVAVLLDVPAGTLASLLSRGRELLRDQLSRQGVAVGAHALGPLLLAEAHAFALPSGFAAATAKAAGAIHGGLGALAAGASPQAAALSHSALAAMATAKLVLVAGAAALLLAIGGAALALTRAAGRDAGLAMAAVAAPVAPAGASAPSAPGAAGLDAAADDPVAALQARVRALRANDLVALLRLEPPPQQALAEQAWRSGVAAAAGLPMMVDPLLGMSLSEAGRRQLLPLVATLLAHLPSAQWAHDLSAFHLPAPAPSAPTALADPGYASAQRQVAEELLGRLGAWLAQARLDDQALARGAAEHVVAGLGALGIASAAELGRLELPAALLRLGAALAEFKRGVLIYGLEIDAMLDSVRISAPPAPARDPRRRLLEVAFTAFGGAHRIPLLMERRDGRWLPVAGDGWSAAAASAPPEQGF